MQLTRCLLHKISHAERAFQRLRLPISLMKTQTQRENIKLLAEQGALDEQNLTYLKEISKNDDQPWSDDIDDIGDPIHLYRAMVRECSYLPDSVCQKYIKSYISSRFRDGSIALRKLMRQQTRGSRAQNDESNTAGTPLTAPEGEEWMRRRIKMFEDARKAVRLLKDTNRGISEALTRVLFFAYGRIGRRRNELLQPFRRIEKNEVDFMQVTAESAGLRKEVAHNLPPVPPKLEALFRSHKDNRIAKANIKTLGVKIPSKDVWGRTAPQQKMKNQLVDWYATLMSKVFPPLPLAEWEHVGKIATGEIKLKVPVPRRQRGERMAPSFFPGYSMIEEDAHFDTTSGDAAEFTDKLRTHELDEALSALGHDSTKSPKSAAHNYTPRFMRRRYKELFELCPSLRWNAEKKKWKYEWGRIVPILKKGGVERYKILAADEMEIPEAERKLDTALDLGNKSHLYGRLTLD